MGKPLPTVVIEWEGDSGFLIINESKFDPSIHKLYEGKLPETKSDPTPTQVDINTATLDELMALPIIGGAKANKILENRPFESLEDLKGKTQIDLTKIAHLIQFSEKKAKPKPKPVPR